MCWDKEILLSLKDMPRYVEEPEPDESKCNADPNDNVVVTCNPNWLADARKIMISHDSMETKALTGLCYNAYKKIASKSILLQKTIILNFAIPHSSFTIRAVTDKDLGINNPDAVIFADAYRKALDYGKHGGQIFVPKRLFEYIPKNFHKYLTG